MVDHLPSRRWRGYTPSTRRREEERLFLAIWDFDTLLPQDTRCFDLRLSTLDFYYGKMLENPWAAGLDNLSRYATPPRLIL